MNILQRLLRARRQSDAFKLALILFGLAGYFIWAGAAQLADFTAAFRSPAEYILESSYTGAVLDAGIGKIKAMENVAAVSRQREYTVAAEGRAVTVTELEREYLAQVYGVSPEELAGFRLSLSDFSAVTCGSSYSLKDATTIRVMLETSDFSGTVLAGLEALGFHPVNREQITVKNYETQLLLTRLEYRLMAAALALIAGTSLTKIAKIKKAPP